MTSRAPRTQSQQLARLSQQLAQGGQPQTQQRRTSQRQRTRQGMPLQQWASQAHWRPEEAQFPTFGAAQAQGLFEAVPPASSPYTGPRQRGQAVNPQRSAAQRGTIRKRASQGPIRSAGVNVPANFPGATQFINEANRYKKQPQWGLRGPTYAPDISEVNDAFHGMHGGGWEYASMQDSGIEGIIEYLANRSAQCPPEEIRRFAQLVYGSQYIGEDIVDIVRSAVLAGVAPKAVDARLNRVDSLRMRSAAGSTGLPSLLWAVVDRDCGSLRKLNDFIESVAFRTLAGQLPNINAPFVTGSPEERQRINQAVSEFLVTHRECTSSREDIEQFLELIDYYQLNGRDVKAIVRTLGLAGELPRLFSGTTTRVGNINEFSPVTLGRPGRRGSVQGSTNSSNPSQNLSQLTAKMSLLYSVVGQFCGQLNQVNKVINGLLYGNQNRLTGTARRSSTRSGRSRRASGASIGQQFQEEVRAQAAPRRKINGTQSRRGSQGLGRGQTPAATKVQGGRGGMSTNVPGRGALSQLPTLYPGGLPGFLE